ncbi:MAG: hypothetical protein N2595_05525, partial [bacterium]|nr:hypothetical protein [bacterium]
MCIRDRIMEVIKHRALMGPRFHAGDQRISKKVIVCCYGRMWRRPHGSAEKFFSKCQLKALPLGGHRRT